MSSSLSKMRNQKNKSQRKPKLKLQRVRLNKQQIVKVNFKSIKHLLKQPVHSNLRRTLC